MVEWRFIYSLENMSSGYTEAPGETLSEEEAQQIAEEEGALNLVVDVEKVESD